MEHLKRLASPRYLIALAWLAFQLYLLYDPLPLQVSRPVHICLALATVFLWQPLQGARAWHKALDWLLALAAFAVLAYYLADAARLAGRMENVDEVMTRDLVMGTLVLVILMEAVRRVVGWSLIWVIAAFVAYGFLGRWFPGWMAFQGFEYALFIEFMTMATHGILGVTTQTSVDFVWYFLLFGVVYSATGGGQLFIDSALKLVGQRKGGAAKSEIVASAMFGTISGSAVANVVATGIFTIPLMKRTGYSPEEAAAHEATASTGGQLMPPVMGIAAFVMAELLAVPYSRIALAGIIPAVAYYFALYMIVDLKARRRGIGTLSAADLKDIAPLAPRLHLYASPLVLIALLATDYSATTAAMAACVVALVTCYFTRATRLSLAGWLDMVEEVARQAAQVAVPIIAIGIIVAIAIQSNLALKFSTELIALSGGTLIGAMLMIILGCIVMGMGLPTVAAYIIGAILFVPAMTKLGVTPLAAHFFVMYYCVLSMITPPVALASYAAAGLANADAMRTGWIAFKLSFVLFLIPFAFAFDPALLWSGPPGWIALAFASMMVATFAWAVMLEGYLAGAIGLVLRGLFGAAALTILFAPTGSGLWAAGCVACALLAGWTLWAARGTAADAPR
ncbi:MAG: TRAP transporter fused permease subunit [Burkholderiales bacterium]|nr:TRAP transporter fused permease subunit [Burkholderiales bacterium]